jgi:DNA-binding MarR family transcriptional regulator
MAEPRTRVVRDAPRTVTRKDLLVGESDETFRQLVHGLLAFSERLMAVRQGFGQVLGTTIASHLHLSGAFVTTVTNQLERKGLIRKVRDPDDRRRAVLTTTPRGRELLARLAPLQQQVNDALFEPLTREQFRELAGRVDALVASADRALALLEYLQSR